MSEEQKKYRVVKLKKHNVPQFKAKSNSRREYVLYGDEKPWFNTYPDFLITLFNESSKHNAIVNGKCKFILGEGWKVEGAINVDQLARATAMLTRANSEGERLDDVQKKIQLDEIIFGGFALQVIWGRDGLIKELFHIDFSKVRRSVDGTKFFFTSDWTTSKPENNDDWTVYEPFNPDKKSGKQLLYYKAYRPDLQVYPLPEYIAAVSYIDTDTEIAKYHLNNIKNGFTAGKMINFNDGPPETDEEAEAMEELVNAKATGSDNAGTVLLNWSRSKEHSATIEDIQPGNLDKQFLQLNDQVRDEIFIAHNVASPMLFGVKTAGQLGGRTELIEANELFQNTYVRPKQKIYEDILNALAVYWGVNGNPYFLKPLEPIEFQFSEQAIANALTAEEIRDIVLPKLGIKSKGDTFRTKMSMEEDEKFLAQFALFGQDADKFEVLATSGEEFQPKDAKDCEAMEEAFIEKHKDKFVITGVVTDLERQIINMIKGDPNITSEVIANALNIEPSEALERINDLVERGAIVRVGEALELTEDADALLEEEPVDEIMTVYRYVVRPNAPSLIGSSRAFCSRLLALNRLYTRADIDLISATVGRDVWQRRGGWLHNHETDVNTPYCRHIWQQQIVRRSRG